MELLTSNSSSTPPHPSRHRLHASSHDGHVRRPSATQLLETPGALLTRSDLRELGLERRAIDAVFRELPVVALPGYSRPMIHAEDYLELVARHTYRDDRVRPMRRWHVASAWIARRPDGTAASATASCTGSAAANRRTSYGGSFRTKREAKARRAGSSASWPPCACPISAARADRRRGRRWRRVRRALARIRIDVAEGTRPTYRVTLWRILAAARQRDASTRSRRRRCRRSSPSSRAERPRARVDPQDARDARDGARLRRRRAEPGSRQDREAAARGAARDRRRRPPSTSSPFIDLLPPRYRLPLLVLDATGMRVGELEQLTWGDVDEPRGRWRVSQRSLEDGPGALGRRPRAAFAAVLALVPRDDRAPDGRVFHGVRRDRLRTAITRACTAAGVPAFSPHDLRHRRISLLHLGGVPWARIGEHVGQRNLAVTANTYTHVLVDESEIDYGSLVVLS